MTEDADPLHDEATLHAYVDGRLAPAARAVVQARLDSDPEAARIVRAWQEQQAALQALQRDVLTEPVPPSLLQAAQRLQHRSSRFGQWQRWGGMAAALLLAFGLGWGGSLQWRTWQESGFGMARARGVVDFARQAQVAYTVFSPEVRHPVEVEAAQQQHLVQWLSKRLNRPLKVPNLTEQGFELVGGRLLPGGDGARAQFMFQSAAGERITLYVGAIDAKVGAASGETAFRYTSEGAVASFYWVDQGFGYALTGRTPRAKLLVLAEAVFKQL
jgi:anti-sigma factor RsiW